MTNPAAQMMVVLQLHQTCLHGVDILNQFFFLAEQQSHAGAFPISSSQPVSNQPLVMPYKERLPVSCREPSPFVSHDTPLLS